jgi:formylglycine-generating enzyme required for sulfatase activity
MLKADVRSILILRNPDSADADPIAKLDDAEKLRFGLAVIMNDFSVLPRAEAIRLGLPASLAQLPSTTLRKLRDDGKVDETVCEIIGFMRGYYAGRAPNAAPAPAFEKPSIAAAAKPAPAKPAAEPAPRQTASKTENRSTRGAAPISASSPSAAQPATPAALQPMASMGSGESTPAVGSDAAPAQPPQSAPSSLWDSRARQEAEAKAEQEAAANLEVAAVKERAVRPDQAQLGAARSSVAEQRSPEQRGAPFDVFRDCPDCPEMVRIPAGRFSMGAADGGERAEGPEHSVSVSRFAIGKCEVSFAQWDSCVADGGCSHRPDDGKMGRGERPVINVNWEDAQQYAKWISGKTGQSYRLPTEAEWEYAARAGTTTRYSFGDSVTPEQVNARPDQSSAARLGRLGIEAKATVSVGSLPANPWGLHEVHGNVYEWVADDWHGTYKGAPADGSAWIGESRDSKRVVRSGSWGSRAEFSRSTYRLAFDREKRIDRTGFRLARDQKAE